MRLSARMLSKRAKLEGFLVSHGFKIDTEIKNLYDGKYFSGTEVEKSNSFASLLIEGEATNGLIELISTSCDLDFLRDARSVLDYGIDLVFGWLMEDFMLLAMLRLGVPIQLHGADREREFLNLSEITVDPDFELTVRGRPVGVELVKDYDGYWRRTGKLDMRLSKFRTLSSGTQKLLLAIDLSHNQWFCVSVSQAISGFQIRPNPAWGGKSVATLPIDGLLTNLHFDSTFVDILLKALAVEERLNTAR